MPACGTDLYVFNGGDHPVIVFDRAGNFITSWGEGLLSRPHAVTMGQYDTIFLTLDGDHAVPEFSFGGETPSHHRRAWKASGQIQWTAFLIAVLMSV
jgi:hypothetical protein